MNLALLSRFSSVLILLTVATAADTDVDLDGNEQDVGNIPIEYRVSRVLRVQDWCGTELEERMEKLAKYEASVPEEPTFEQAREIGLSLGIVGRWTKARELLLRAEELRPGDAEVAFVLSQCSEGLNDLPAAVTWAERALDRQPSDPKHIWLHVRILRAKAGCLRDAGWLKKYGALGLNFGTGERPTLDRSLPKKIYPDLQAFLSALRYHVSDRCPAVELGKEVPTKRDPFVAEMLLDFGDVLALQGAVKTAIPWYELAQTMEAQRSQLVSARLAYARKVVAQKSTDTRARGKSGSKKTGE